MVTNGPPPASAPMAVNFDNEGCPATMGCAGAVGAIIFGVVI